MVCHFLYTLVVHIGKDFLCGPPACFIYSCSQGSCHQKLVRTYIGWYKSSIIFQEGEVGVYIFSCRDQADLGVDQNKVTNCFILGNFMLGAGFMERLMSPFVIIKITLPS